MIRHLILLTTSISAIFLSQPAFADIILLGRCPRDICLDQKFMGKTLLQRDEDSSLYSVQIAYREWNRLVETEPGQFGAPETRYVHCSTTRPAIIYPSDTGLFAATLLNPGSVDTPWSTFWDYQVYWVTCHNFVGPDFFSQEMTHRAIRLGYPLDLKEDYITLSHLNDIMN